MKIGIGVTTRNRPEVFELWTKYYLEFKPPTNVLWSYDDASDVLYKKAAAHEKGTTRLGISGAKNKCLKALYEAGCTHIFLFDDDCFPVVDKWWEPFINTGCPHLNFIPISPKLNSTITNRRGPVVEVSLQMGCMIYLDVAQTGEVYFDEAYKIYGYEHCEFSRRLHREGKAWFVNATLENATDLIYSLDWHFNWNHIKPPLWQLETDFKSSMEGEDAQQYVLENAKIYDNT